MKHKLLISLTGAVLSSSLVSHAAIASSIFAENTQTASVRSSRKLPAKLVDSRINPIFRPATLEMASNMAPTSSNTINNSLAPKPETTPQNSPANTLNAVPEISFEVSSLNNNPSGNNSSGNNENEPTVVNSAPVNSAPVNSSPTNLPASGTPAISPSVEVAVNPYVVPEVVPEAVPEVVAPVRTSYQQGEASWYGPGFDGNYSANGEIFNRYAMTAAHPSLPFGTRVLVTNIDNGRSVVVRINDRGPFSGGRIIDLSQGAAASIGMIESGVADVQLDIIEP